MSFNQTALYGMRTMAWLAAQPPDRCWRSSEIAEGTRISETYVSKVLRRLVQAGLLNSRKGHRGGFGLARAPHEIRFHEVLDALDAMPDPRACAYGWERCNAKDPCPLHDVWEQYVELATTWAMTHTLADAVREPDRFAEMPSERSSTVS